MILNVAEWISYSSTAHDQAHNDIGLIRLERKINFNKYIRSACLPPVLLEEHAQKKTIATGWGHIGFADGMSNTLLYVGLEKFADTVCEKMFHENGNKINVTTQMCAGSRDGTGDTCSVILFSSLKHLMKRRF